MKDVPLKIRLFFLPFVLVAVCTIGFYSLIHYLYLLSGAELVNEEWIQFFIPMGLVALVAYIWLYPRYKLIKKKKSGDPAFGFAFIAAFAILPSLVITQTYIDKAVGSLTTADNVWQIDNLPKSKYYILKNCYFDKYYAGTYTDIYVSGKYNNDLNFSFYVALPLFTDAGDTVVILCKSWLGRSYHKTVGNRGTTDEKEKKLADFKKECIDDFYSRDFKQFTYLVRAPKSEKRANFLKAIRRSVKPSSATASIFTAETEPFANRTGEKLKWAFISLIAGIAAFGLLILFPAIDGDKLQQYESGAPVMDGDDGESKKVGLSFFIPQGKFFVTPLIIDLNIAIFVIMIVFELGFISFKGPDLLKWGANYRPATVSGQWWRLVTNTFLHGGLMHILGNMFGLYFVGLFLEPILGRVKYLVAYLITGIIASAASIWWHPATVSVGASGAIFGLYGVFLSLLLANVFPEVTKKAMLKFALFFIGYNLLYGIAGGIDNAAHIGGLASGLILGLIFSLNIEKAQPPAEEAPESIIEKR